MVENVLWLWVALSLSHCGDVDQRHWHPLYTDYTNKEDKREECKEVAGLFKATDIFPPSAPQRRRRHPPPSLKFYIRTLVAST